MVTSRGAGDVVGAGATLASQLVEAGVDDQPIRPPVEVIGTPQAGQLPPDLDQGLLGRVSGQLAVAQDPVRHRVEPVAEARGELGKGVSVAPLRSLDQVLLHALLPGAICSIAPYDGGRRPTIQLFATAPSAPAVRHAGCCGWSR